MLLRLADPSILVAIKARCFAGESMAKLLALHIYNRNCINTEDSFSNFASHLYRRISASGSRMANVAVQCHLTGILAATTMVASRNHGSQRRIQAP